MKTYNQTNFFKYTFCEFVQVDDFEFPGKTNFKSKSESSYFYNNEGVYRKSNHWGRVANCRWKLITNKQYKNQQFTIGYAKWSDFYPTNSNEKLFWISVDFKHQQSSIKATRETDDKFLMHLSEAHQKVKAIKKLFSNDKWANYFELDLDELREKIIKQLINSNKTIQEIKRDFK